ncbi:hypothetical protein E2320_003646, partial [Naja naja]
RSEVINSFKLQGLAVPFPARLEKQPLLLPASMTSVIEGRREEVVKKEEGKRKEKGRVKEGEREVKVQEKGRKKKATPQKGCKPIKGPPHKFFNAQLLVDSQSVTCLPLTRLPFLPHTPTQYRQIPSTHPQKPGHLPFPSHAPSPQIHPPPAGHLNHRILLPRPPSVLCSPLSNSLQTSVFLFLFPLPRFPFAPGRAIVHRQDTAVSSSWGERKEGGKAGVEGERKEGWGVGVPKKYFLKKTSHVANIINRPRNMAVCAENRGRGERDLWIRSGRVSLRNLAPPGDQAPPHLNSAKKNPSRRVFCKESSRSPPPPLYHSQTYTLKACTHKHTHTNSLKQEKNREWNVTNRNRVSSSPLFTIPKTTVVSTTQEVMAVQSPWFGGGREGRRENAAAGGRTRMQDQPSERNALTPQRQVSCPETLKGENWQYESNKLIKFIEGGRRGWPKTLRTSSMVEKTKRGSDSEEGELLPDLPDERAGILKIPAICGKRKERGIRFKGWAYSVWQLGIAWGRGRGGKWGGFGAHRIGEVGNHQGENRAGGGLGPRRFVAKNQDTEKKKNREKGPI